MFHPIDKWNVRLGNDLDVDLKITLLQNFQSKYVLLKKVIVNATMVKNNSDCEIYASMEKYLAMTNGKIMVRLKTETEHLCKRGDRVQNILWNKSSV